jgi:ABC-type multidrug transport system ATPase subunit
MTMLDVTDIGKRFGRRRVLEAVTFTCEPGCVLALVGENGSGKSTLLRIVAGVLEPDEGAVTIGGDSLSKQRQRALQKLGYVPEAADPLPHLTAAELIDLVTSLRRAPPSPAALSERLGTAQLSGQLIGSLSLGQRRRVCLHAALVGDPPLLVLDEPTNGLDPDGVAMLGEVLHERATAGAAAVVATHDLPFADRIATRRIRMAKGQLTEP